MNDASPINASIGVPTPLVDGPDKVTGRALYAADFPSRETLVGRILRSPVAHAHIVQVDASKAERLEGVHAVVTGADVAAPYGVLPIAMNEYALAKDRVRYRGEPVAAVAAIDVDTAAEALRLIDVQYKMLPAYFSAPEARDAEAVQLHFSSRLYQRQKPFFSQYNILILSRRRLMKTYSVVSNGFSSSSCSTNSDSPCMAFLKSTGSTHK